MNRAGFGMGASFHPSYTVLEGNSSISKNQGSSLCPQLRTWKILIRYIDRRNALSTLLEKSGRSERDKLGRHRSTKLTVPFNSSSDARPLDYHSNYQALSTAQFRRAGQLATADTCTSRPQSFTALWPVLNFPVPLRAPGQEAEFLERVKMQLLGDAYKLMILKLKDYS